VNARSPVTIIEALQDEALFAPPFRDRSTWLPWWTFSKALFGLPMNESDLALFRECAGLYDPPTEQARSAWCIIGRRGGKSRWLALLAAYLATFIDWTPYLAPGERGSIVVIAADRKQCRTIMGYLRSFLGGTGLLSEFIERDAAEEIELSNGVTVEVVTCSFRSTRGRTIIAAICDEAAFWADDTGANPASEVIASLRPAMATIPGSMLLVASSPYWQRGPLWEAFKRHYGKPGRILVWRAPTWVMNPMLPRDCDVIAEAYELDDVSARSEYGAEWRSDIDTYVSREVVDAVTMRGRHELLPVSGISYFGFVDPSGGSSDSMVLATGHRSGDLGVLDALREWKPPFSPDAVVQEATALLKSYGITTVVGDRYAGEWPRERFREHGIAYEPSERTKNDLYREFLPLLNAGRCELLDHPRMLNQLCALERRVARGGKDSVDHAPGGHDDLPNAVAGVMVNVAGAMDSLEIWRRLVA
jgi:hypothetical protein